MKIERTEKGDRGLGWYLDDKIDTYRQTRIEVSESSAAMHPCCWLRMEEPEREHLGEKHGGNCAAHLDVEGVDLLIAALQEWKRVNVSEEAE